MTKQLIILALLALLFIPISALGQDPSPPGQRFIEFGFRGINGSVERRTNPGEIPFSNNFRPDILNSGINIYRDYRNGFYIPRAYVFVDDVLGSKSYFSLQTVNNGIAFSGRTMPRDQSLLVSVGRHGLYKLQFRWDQTPHITSGTTRSLFNQTSPGVWKYSGNRAALDAARVLGTGIALFSAVTPQVANAVLDVQRGLRKTGSGLASWDINPDWNVAFLFTRERQVGTRPHNMCFGNSPSCYSAEVPENIDYATNTFKVGTDFGQKTWGMQLGFQRQSFENNVPHMLVENPFSNNVNSATVTSNGNLSLYPNNKAHNLLFGGALHLAGVHFMTSISPGWNSQNDRFVAYTTNEFLLNRTGAAAPIPLPVPSLNGERRTLAMNYTAVGNPSKNLELAARYRHYDNKNKTEEHLFNPYVGDLAASSSVAGPSGQEVKKFAGVNGLLDLTCPGICNEPFSFTTKEIELSGTYFLSQKSLAKVQYTRQWFNREHRDVKQTIEDTFKFSTDLKPTSDLTFRIAGAIQDREPQDTDYPWFLIPGTQRPDEGFRRRYRADLLAQYDLTDRLSVSGFYRTVQDNFNRRDILTSFTPLGDPARVRVTTVNPTPIYGPYYVYGLLKELNWNWGGDFDFLVNEKMTLFGEYTRERYTNRQVSRQRSRSVATQVGCPSTVVPEDCDPINDWMTFERDIVDTYTVGTDVVPHKKLNVSLYYSLAASTGNTFSDGVNCQIGKGPNDNCRTNFPNWRLDNATNRAVTFSFPENVSRLHEANAIVKFQLSESLSPKFEYRYQRFDYKDFQTSVMNPYSYVGPVIDPAGTTGLHRMVFLGADTPGYRAHVFTGTLTYHF